MNCLNCGTILINRSRIKKDASGIAYHFNHCPNCIKDFDENNDEIIHLDDKYMLKKDSIDPKELKND